MVRAALEQQGIEAHVTGEMLSGLAGVIPVFDAMPQLWVPESDSDRAVSILQELVGEDASGQLSIAPPGGEISLPKEEKRCPKCGESSPAHFDTCWSCGTKFGSEANKASDEPSKAPD